jgi:hypothetical protein
VGTLALCPPYDFRNSPYSASAENMRRRQSTRRYIRKTLTLFRIDKY